MTSPTPTPGPQTGADGGGDSWWVIGGDVFKEALQRAHEGEDPDLLYTEFYANSEEETP